MSDAATAEDGPDDHVTDGAGSDDAGTDGAGTAAVGTADPGDDAGTERVGPVDRSPTYLSSALALGAGAVATTAGTYSVVGLAGCVAGVLVLAAGLATGRQALVTLAGGTLVGGVLVGVAGGAPALAALVGVAAALLAFDFGSTAVGLGEQLGREAPTLRLELVHAVASTLVGLGFVFGGFAIHEIAAGGQPTSAVFGLALAVVVLLAALRHAGPVTE
jgi:hypothetical protein